MAKHYLTLLDETCYRYKMALNFKTWSSDTKTKALVVFMVLELFEDANDGVKRGKKWSGERAENGMLYIVVQLWARCKRVEGDDENKPELVRRNFKRYWTGHLLKVSTFDSFQTRSFFVAFFLFPFWLSSAFSSTTTDLFVPHLCCKWRTKPKLENRIAIRDWLVRR